MVKKKNIIYLSIILVIVITFITIILGTSKKAYSQVADIESFTSDTSSLNIAYYDDTVPSYKQLPMNYVNIDSYPGKSAVFEVEGNSNILKKNVDYVSQENTNNMDIIYYKVTDGSLLYGTGVRDDSTDAVMGSSNKIAGKILLRYNDAAVLNDGKSADVKVEFSDIEFKLGKDPGLANTTDLYISILSLYDTSTWTMVQAPNKSEDFTNNTVVTTKNNSGNDASLDIAMSMKISISVLEKGTDTPIDSKYKQTLFGINDLDIPNHTKKKEPFSGRYAASAAGAYAEGVVLNEGFTSPVALAHKNNSNILERTYLKTETVSINGESKLRIQGDGDRYSARRDAVGTNNDQSTYYSGLIVPANPQGFSFYWYGSEHDLSNLSMGSKLGGLPQVPVTASKICPENNSNCGTISYEGTEDHNFNSTPIYKYTPAEGYKVKSLKVNGEEVDYEQSGGSYKFTQLYRDPLVSINQDGSPGESFDTENTYEIEVEFEEEPIVVKYTSDSNGKISGTTKEEVKNGENPQGTTEEANKGYHLIGWRCDVARTLNDGNIIEAYKITPYEDILNTKITSNMTCTALHETDIYTVEYETDAGGKLSISREELNYGKNPTVKYTLNDDYNFIGWTCNNDVTLNDGTKIAKNKTIEQTKINEIKIEDNLKCKANTAKKIYKSVPKNPTTSDKIKPYILAALLSFLGITFTVLLIEDRKAKN